MNNIDLNKVLKEVKFGFSRSGGKGGQNVNKVETKVELVFNIDDSLVIDEKTKALLKKKLYNRIDKENNIRLFNQTERTQLGNKKKAIEKFIKLVNNALKKEAIRVKTVKSYSSKEAVLKEKKKHSAKKKERGKKDFLDE
jgi:ribosome-associated protein